MLEDNELIKADIVQTLLRAQFQCHISKQDQGCDLKCVDSSSHWKKPNKCNSERNALPRLSFSMSACILKSPAIITLSVLRARVERNSENSDYNSGKGPGARHPKKQRWVFMVGSEMLRIRFSNELYFCFGFGFINRAELNYQNYFHN